MDRRRFLGAVATAIGATPGVASSAVAIGADAAASERRGRRTPAAAAAGVARSTEARVEAAIRRGDQREAARLLDASGVDHGARRVGMPAVGNGGAGTAGTAMSDRSGVAGGSSTGGDGVSTQDVYVREDSSFWLYVWHRGGDVYRAYASWELELSATSWIDGAGPDDGVGITVSEDHWEPVIDSWAFGDRTALDERGALGVIGRFDDAQPGCDGLGCGDPPPSARTGWQRVDLRKKEPGSHNVYGSYVHTWNPWRVPGWVEFTLGVGPVSAKTSGNVDSWTRRSDMNL